MSLFAVIGFGSNLGDRLATMRAALHGLGRAARVDKTSHVYATAPVGPVAQPEFLNAAATVHYPGAPEALLDVLLGIEADLGRVRAEKWGPRTIDLDILWARDTRVASASATTSRGGAGRAPTIVHTERLRIPHPRLGERAFALIPLLELVPDAIDPHTGARYLVPAADDIRITPDLL